ncbi:hypothetical protein GOP47_0003778 [Adiantum capillus-veneris]|uniref:Uncharacterized protein n=1 Tax=Adiantum capillus-veneris TaxID=13818 RepID=A0A9D4V696_ADICA|nr:hypothetical protein GOP47_0003778 [Adiantum capillus-veneris]
MVVPCKSFLLPLSVDALKGRLCLNAKDHKSVFGGKGLSPLHCEEIFGGVMYCFFDNLVVTFRQMK